MDKKFGALTSSANPQEMAKTVEGLMKAVAGALLFFGVASVTEANTLTSNIGNLVTLGFSFYGAAESAFGIIRKIVVRAQAKFI
jgi:hypothetical protein